VVTVGHVLLVDASTTVRARLTQSLVEEGLAVTAFTSAQEALNHVDEWSFDLAVIDRNPHDAAVEPLLTMLLERPEEEPMHLLLLDPSPMGEGPPMDVRITRITDPDEVITFIQSLQQPRPDSPNAASRARVLVVDDSPTFRSSMRSLLSERWDVVEADLGGQVLPQMRAGPVHAILLDHELPDRLGIEVCRDIRRVPEYATIPIIMLTATDSEVNTLKAFAAGADDYVIKGGNDVVLLARLGSHIRRYRSEMAARNAYASLRQSEADAYARKELLAVVQLKSQELMRVNDELDRFAALASHDIQAPLRTITSYLGMIQARSKDLDPALRSFFARAMKSSEDACRLVDNLLQYARSGWTDTAKDAPCDSILIAREAADSLATQVEKAAAVITIGSLDPVVCDPICLKQVFENIISNALKYRSEAPPRIQVGSQADGRMVRFTITDNGVGVPAEHRQRIFQMFQRLYGSEIPGTGIGLSLCKKIITCRGGTLGVEPGPTGGSAFWFTVPAVPAA